jgi:acyl carrier protein
MEQTLERVQQIFRDVFDNPELKISKESHSGTVENWDSLAHITLVSTIEQEFRIHFALGELQELKNVGEMIDLIEKKIQN